MVLKVWKDGFLGRIVLAMGIGAGYVDIATRFLFPFIGDHFEIVFLTMLRKLLHHLPQEQAGVRPALAAEGFRARSYLNLFPFQILDRGSEGWLRCP